MAGNAAAALLKDVDIQIYIFASHVFLCFTFALQICVFAKDDAPDIYLPTPAAPTGSLFLFTATLTHFMLRGLHVDIDI